MPVLLGELEKAQMSLFHTGYSLYIPSSSQEERLLSRLLPEVGGILSSLLEGFQQGVHGVLRVNAHLLVGQVNIKVDTYEEKNFAQLEAAKWCQYRERTFTHLCSPGHQSNGHLSPASTL